MIDRKAASRYARSFFLLAEKRNELDPIDKDFQRVRGLVEKHPEITHLVLNSTISGAEKEDFIEKVFLERQDGGSHQPASLLLNFLKVLIKKSRFRELAPIQAEFHRLYERKRGILEVELLTARPLLEVHEEKFRTVLKKRLGSEIRLVAHTDPSLIGGFVLRAGSREIDASYKNQLFELRQRLTT